MGCLGSHWAPLGLFGPSLGPSWALWALTGALLGCLGPHWGSLGLFGPSLGPLGLFGLSLGPSWALCALTGTFVGYFGLSKGLNPKIEKIAIFVCLSLMFSNEIETSGDYVSGTTALWEVLLGFFGCPLGSPFKNTSKLEKCQKSREIAFFLVGRPLGFPLKLKLRAAITRVPHGVGGSQVGF